MDGKEVAEGIAAAYRFAYSDPYRACTHNKGVMNGIDPVRSACELMRKRNFTCKCNRAFLCILPNVCYSNTNTCMYVSVYLCI